MVVALVLSAVLDGCTQGLNYVAQVQGGIMLFTIFSSSVTLFVCILVVLFFGGRIMPIQWVAVGMIVLGLLSTSIPNPLVAEHSFFWGFVCSMLAALCASLSYPFSEQVFRAAEGKAPGEETACFFGSAINVLAFSIWTAAYTVPRWHESIVEPLLHSRQPSVALAVLGYSLFALMVGAHALAFWKAINKAGTVPTAVSRGAQQSGTFVVAHLLFCDSDHTQCFNSSSPMASTWIRWRKSVAFLLCCAGVFLYSIGKHLHTFCSASSSSEKASELELEDVMDGDELCNDAFVEESPASPNVMSDVDKKMQGTSGLRKKTLRCQGRSRSFRRLGGKAAAIDVAIGGVDESSPTHHVNIEKVGAQTEIQGR